MPIDELRMRIYTEYLMLCHNDQDEMDLGGCLSEYLQCVIGFPRTECVCFLFASSTTAWSEYPSMVLTFVYWTLPRAIVDISYILRFGVPRQDEIGPGGRLEVMYILYFVASGTNIMELLQLAIIDFWEGVKLF